MKFKKICLSVLFLLAAAMLLCGCMQIRVDFHRDGSGTATLEIASSEETEIVQAELDRVLAAINAFGDSTKLEKKSFTATEGGYQAEIRFRRIGELKGVGEYNFLSGDRFAEDINKRSVIRRLSSGTYPTLQNYDGSLVTAAGDMPTILPRSVAGEQWTPDEFLENCSADVSVFSFVSYLGDNVASVTLRFPGKVLAASDLGVTVIDKNTVRLTPVQARMTHSRVEDSSVQQETRETNIYAGYVLFEPSVSAAWFAVLGIAVVGIGALVFCGFRFHWGRRIRSGKFLQFFRREWGLFVMLVPGTLLMVVFCYIPMAGLVVAFKDYNVADGIFGSEWVGLENFLEMFEPQYHFWRTLRNTVVIALLKFVVGYPASIILALLFSMLVYRSLKKIVQTASYLPYFISWVMIAGIAYNFLTANNGVINNVLELCGKEPINWYNDASHWWAILTITSVWKGMGWGTIVFLAAISAINEELYEAASMDGASPMRQVFCVTIPGMMPVIGFTFVLNMGNLIKDDADQIMALVGSGNYALDEKVSVFGTSIYNALQSGPGQFSSATALGFFQGVISLILVFSSNLIVRRRGYQALW